MSNTYGSGPHALSGYGGIESVNFQVVSAISLNAFEVKVDFNKILDVSFSSFLFPSNYSIVGLTVNSVIFDGPFSVRLSTTEQIAFSYTVEVNQGLSFDGKTLDPNHDTAIFVGTPSLQGFKPIALSSTRVRVLFGEPMLANASLGTPANYVVKDLQNNQLGISEVIIEQPNNPVSVVLKLTSPLNESTPYNLNVMPAVQTLDGVSVASRPQIFVWEHKPLTLKVGIERFSGEIKGGLFGNPEGLVYFSPALSAPIANSKIKIEEVTTCTKAYDSYHPPVLIDPPVLYTFTENRTNTTTNSDAVCFASWPQLAGAKVEVHSKPQDNFSPPVDGKCVLTLAETLMVSKIALTNNPYWETFGGSNQTFITADTIAPIPSGTTTVIVLVP